MLCITDGHKASLTSFGTVAPKGSGLGRARKSAGCGENARTKPRLRKEAEIPDEDLELREFEPESPGLSILVTQIGMHDGALCAVMHQYGA
ncbi:hypothetical protein AWT69_000388 [Pseudomonas putida]|nr:hypothetical protein AWT69_000388 [Pseudomonas putida]